MFDELVVSNVVKKRTNTRWTIVLSTTLQVLVIGIFILIPLIYTEALPTQLLNTFLVAPPPPPPPPPPPAAVVHQVIKPVVRLMHNGELTAPTAIPKKVEMIKEEQLPPDVGTAVVGGVPGGVPGGSAGGVLGGILGGIGNGPPPPPPKAATPQRIRIGGNVQQAKIARMVQPIYPAIAKTAHIQGTVVLHAIIAKDGTVQELQYISGPPLLMKSAMDAVRQWRYQPTLLNGEPVEVDTTISVIFTLGG
jgi:periplasmic protein TonB